MESKLNISFKAIGTAWSIDFFERLSEDKSALLKKKILSRIDQFDLNYSRFRKDSLVSKMAMDPGKYVLPEDAKLLMDLYYEIYWMSSGKVTPLVGKLLSETGYDAEYSLQSLADEKLSKVDAWEDVLEYRYPELVVKKEVLLDFGAAGKGYLIDIVGKIIADFGIKNYCVDAGGDILYRTAERDLMEIGLEDPNDFSQVIGVAKIRNKSICGSAGNRRKWGKYNHIMDPQKLSSVKNIAATWVIAETTILADAIATCLFFMDIKAVARYYNFDAFVLYEDYSFAKSENFPAELFMK